MNIYEIVSSPTGGTKKVANFLAAELSQEIRGVDLSNCNEDFPKFSFVNVYFCKNITFELLLYGMFMIFLV